MCDPILVTLLKMQPYYSHNSRENATPSSGTSPLASCKGVPPPPGFLENLTGDCSSHVGPLKSTWSFLSLIRIAFLSINATIGFDVPESLIRKSSITALVAVTSGAVDKVLFTE